jgi:hypothetical protein
MVGVDEDRRFLPQLCPLTHGSTFPVRLLREPPEGLARAHADGLTPAQVKAKLGTDKDFQNTMKQTWPQPPLHLCGDKPTVSAPQM